MVRSKFVTGGVRMLVRGFAPFLTSSGLCSVKVCSEEVMFFEMREGDQLPVKRGTGRSPAPAGYN